jgi:hypothetical protein
MSFYRFFAPSRFHTTKTHLRHKLDRNFAAQQSPAVSRCAILQSTGGTGQWTTLGGLAIAPELRVAGQLAVGGSRVAYRAEQAGGVAPLGCVDAVCEAVLHLGRSGMAGGTLSQRHLGVHRPRSRPEGIN